MVFSDMKTYVDTHKASFIYFVKTIVSDLRTEGNLEVYEMTEDKKRLCERDNLLENKPGIVYASRYTVAYIMKCIPYRDCREGVKTQQR